MNSCPSRMPRCRTGPVIQWEKNDLEDLGLLKVDVLGLGMLTAIRRSFDLIRDFGGRQLTLANVPAEDPRCV